MIGVHFVPAGVLQQISDSDQSQRLGVGQSDVCCPTHVEMPDAAVAEVVGEELALAGVPAFGTMRVEHRRLLRFVSWDALVGPCRSWFVVALACSSTNQKASPTE